MEGDIMGLIKSRMDGEIGNFVKVWLTVIISLSYSYFAGKVVPKGTIRLITFLPVVSLFLYLPLTLHSMQLGGLTAFFVAWLSNFKLLLFAFNTGPLSHPSLSLPHFIALACLPIKIQQSKTDPSLNQQNPSQNGQITEKGLNSPMNYAMKALLLALFLKIYDYRDYIHPNLILFIYFFHIYFLLEIILAMVAVAARAMFGFEIEQQFNDPYLSTSLQDFWGKRWNLMVTRILRPSVYTPVVNLSTRFLGRRLATLAAVLATFCVSALMHELILYYMGRVRPTGEVTCFFLLHGVCLVVEIAIKKWVNGKWELPTVVTGPLTVVFVLTTAYWLFLLPLLRIEADVKSFQEIAEVGAFLKDVGRALAHNFHYYLGDYLRITELKMWPTWDSALVADAGDI